MRRRPRLGRGPLLTIALCIVILIGVIGYLLFGYSVPEAIAATLLTLTTVGIATSHDLAAPVLLFTAGLAVLGVSLFVVALGVFGAALVEGRLGALSRTRRMHRRIDQLSNHFIVCAYGRVGRSVVRDLEAEGQAVVVVDNKADVEVEMQRDGVLYLAANPSSEQVLREAGIDRARGLICAVDSDAENVYITLVARSIRPDLLIVARAAEEQSADRLFRAGANQVVSPYVTSGRRMAMLAVRPHLVEFFDIARTGQPDLRLEEFEVTADSPMVDRSIHELTGDVVVLLVRRPDGTVIANPSRQLQLHAGDTVVLYGEPQNLRPLDTS